MIAVPMIKCLGLETENPGNCGYVYWLFFNLCPLKKDLIQVPFLSLSMLNRSCYYNVGLAQVACIDADKPLSKSACKQNYDSKSLSDCNNRQKRLQGCLLAQVVSYFLSRVTQ